MIKTAAKKFLLLVLLFVFEETVFAQTPVLTRGPYLQMGNQTAISIRWRTNINSDTKVTWGTVFGIYPNSQTDAASTTEHEIRITGLAADTKYFYTIGGTTTTLQATNTNYFVTAPAANATRKLRFLALGDCGNNSANQANVKNTFINYIGSNDIDAMILLGDNAYSTGLDNEFQTNFFDVYRNDLLRYNKLYPAPGNHDYGNNPVNSGVRNNAYYNSFTLPTAAECGGVASGTEAYYSFDIGNVHFLSLDSYGKENLNTTRLSDTTGAQIAWIKNDLAANTKRWTVAYFHHPPYTKTSHDSDLEAELDSINRKVTLVLERYGVDLVLCGHSHAYERSYLLKGFNTYESLFNKNLHTPNGDTLTAVYNGTANSCAYVYPSSPLNHGTVYVVSGSAGQIGGTAAGYPHNAMHYSNNTDGGCFYFETDSNRLDAKFISYSTAPTPLIRDQFTIFKDVNKVQNITVSQNTPVTLTASWPGTYLWPNNGNASTRSVSPSTASIGTFNYIVRDGTNNCIKDSFHLVVTVPLPVKLHSFDASVKKESVQLDWKMLEELNNWFFTLERSEDGINFQPLARINSGGNTSVLTSYQYIDVNPLEADNIYRLSQTDKDGNAKWLATKRVYLKNGKQFSFTARPAGSGVVELRIQSRKTMKVNLVVSDAQGKKVVSSSLQLGIGTTSKTLELPAGIYNIAISTEEGKTVVNRVAVL